MPDSDNVFRIVVDARRSNAMAALFDMMRYDGNTVVDWTHGTSDLVPDRATADYWTVTLRGKCTRDRWASFAMPVFLWR